MTRRKKPEDKKVPGRKPSTYYSYAEAKATTQRRGITGVAEYRKYCQSNERDPMMPTDPVRIYGEEFEGWPTFCGKTKFIGLSVEKYSYQEASEAAQRLGIKTKKEYERRHNEDPRLPAQPHLAYPDEWPDDKPWYKFLGKLVHYRNFEQVKEAAMLLGIKNKRDYDEKRKKDARLPSSPESMFPDEWKGWENFLEQK